VTTGGRDGHVLTPTGDRQTATTGRRDENVLTPTGDRQTWTTGGRDGHVLTPTGNRQTGMMGRRDEKGYIKADSTRVTTQTQNYVKCSSAEADLHMRNMNSDSEQCHDTGKNSDADLDKDKPLRRTFGVSIDTNVEASLRGKESPIARKLYASVW
jgi:hypothetical protein